MFIPLSEWDRDGKLTSSKQGGGEQIASVLSNMIGGFSKNVQDKSIRRAAATMLGIDENTIPLGMFKQEDLVDLQKEKFKKGLETETLKQVLGIGGQPTVTTPGMAPTAPHPTAGSTGVISPVGGGYAAEEFTMGGVKFKKQPTPEEIAKKIETEGLTDIAKKERELQFTQQKAKEKDLKDADDFINGLAQQFKNTEAAMPGTSAVPAWQRIKATGTRMATWTGVGAKPKETAELATLRIRARSLIKKFEGGRLTDQDVADAVQGMTDIGRTTAERLATIVNLATAIGADKGVPENIAKARLAEQLGITVEDMDSVLSAGQATTKVGKYTLVR